MTFLSAMEWLAAPATAQAARFWLQPALILWLQTAVLLAPGVWTLHVLGKRKSTARSFVGRAVMASVAAIAMCGSLSSGHFAALWQVSLPVAPVVRAEVPSKMAFEAPDFAAPKFAAPRAEVEMQPPSPEMNEATSSIEAVAAAAAAKVERPATAFSPLIVVWGAAIWLSGALILAIWWSGCHFVLWRMRRGAKPVEDPQSRAILSEVCASWQVREPRLLSHSRLSSPFLTGLFRPAIMLPAGVPDVSAASLRAVLGHEIAHLKRRDLWWSALGRMLCALMWPQPGLWILCRQLEQINEEACDRAVLEAGCERHQLAGCLLDWAQRGVPPRAQRVAGAGVWTHRSSLSRRVQAILSEPLGKRRLSKRTRWAIAGAVLLFAASTPFLISGRAAPSGSFRLTDLPLPDPGMKVIGNWAVSVGGAEKGLLNDVKLQHLVAGRVLESYESHTARRAQRTPNWWIMDSALIRLHGGGHKIETRKNGLIADVPDAVSRYLLAQFETAKTRKPLEQVFRNDEGYVSVGGVSNGKLQGISIRLYRAKSVSQMFVARSARRQKVGSSGEVRWVLSDVDYYGFSDAQGLHLQGHAAQMIVSAKSFPASLFNWMDQQSQAAPQPLSDAQWTETKKFSALPRVQIDALKLWAKGQGRSAIVGRVVDEDSQPVAGTTVFLRMADEDLRRASKTPPNDFPDIRQNRFALPKTAREMMAQSAPTDSNGTYRFNGLANVAYDLTTSSYGRNTRIHTETALSPQVLLKEQRVVAAATGETKAPDLKTTRGGLIRVRVEDKDTGAPLPDVNVLGSAKTVPRAPSFTYWVDSDANGQSLFRLPLGTASIAIGGNNRSGSHALVAESNGNFYALTKAAEVSLDGATAQPFPDGTAVQITPGKTREMTIRLSRYVAPKPTPTPRLVPPPAGRATLSGRVVDETGRPVRGVVVRALIQRAAQWKLLQGAGLAGSNSKTPDVEQKRASVGGVFYARDVTGADGSFRLDGLTTAPYNLTVSTFDDDSGVRLSVAAAVEGAWPKEGQITRRAQPIVMTRGGIISGRVVDSVTGAGLGGLILGSNGPQLPSSSDNSMGTHCDAQGRFTLRVAPGTTSLYLMGPAENGGNFVFADSKKTAEAVARIRSSRGVYAGSGGVKFELDGGPSQIGLKWDKGRFDNIQIVVGKGQTRKLTLHLRRLVRE